MAAHQFQVVFLGVVEEGLAVENVREAMAKEFRLQPKFVEHLFSGRPVVVKRSVDAETAMRYKYLIDTMGGNSRIEPMPIQQTGPGMAGFVERRSAFRRQLSDRRCAVRTVGFMDDRRQGCGRRSSDY